MSSTADQLSRALRDSRNTLVVTGAGISVASGIAPFRGTDDAVWENTVLEMGTWAMFQQDPVRQWKWYLDRFDACRDAKPNAAHLALVEMERLAKSRGDMFRIMTQNIDGLHAVAGSQDLIEIHGKARRLRCSRRGCANGAPLATVPWDDRLFDAFRAEPTRENIPRCDLCGKPLRAHVLWFDETYDAHGDYGFEKAREWMVEADLVVFVGTSFAVGITDMALTGAQMLGTPVWTVDPTPPPQFQDTWVEGKAEVVLPAVAEALR